MHCVIHAVAKHWRGIAQGALIVGTVALTVASDGAAAPLLEEEGAMFAGEAATEAAVEGGVDAGVDGGGNVLEDAVTSCVREGNSFVRGTKVLAASGALVPIQKIRVGSKVTSVPQDHVTARARPGTVSALIRHHDQQVFLLQIPGPDIRATAYHPFFVRHRGWTAVRDLRAGMRLRTLSEGAIRLQGITRLHVGAPLSSSPPV